MAKLTRRDALRLFGIGGAVCTTALWGCAPAPSARRFSTTHRDPAEPGRELAPSARRTTRGRPVTERAVEDFYFAQISDTHWGFEGAAANPDAKGTLPKAILALNGLLHAPDFIVFTGDLTHTTDDPKARRKRLYAVRDLAETLRVKNLRFLPGEHDASLDAGEAYREVFGDLHYAFDHKGVHFVALDNVSDPRGRLGAEQIDWLKADLAGHDRRQPIIVLTHRPLFALAPAWGWSTEDGEQALALLLPFARVAVFYGHIHQEHRHMTEHIAHYAARSVIFPLPAPGSTPERKPIPWDAQHPYRGLGVRNVASSGEGVVQAAEILLGDA